MIAVLVAAAVNGPAWCQAQWYGSADFLVMTRSISDTVFQRDEVPGTGAGTFVVGELDVLPLDLDFVAAGRVTLGRRFGDAGFEGSYMHTDTWDVLAEVSDGSGQLASPFSQVGALAAPAVDNNTFASVGYRTEMQSGEFNLTQVAYSGGNGEATFLYGLRGMTIDESFEYFSINAGGTNTLATTAENGLIGPQIGLRTDSPCWYGFVTIYLKGGLLYNEVEFTSDFNGALVDRQIGQATLLGEFAIEYTFMPTHNIAVHAGYQLIGLSDVALATNDTLIADEITDDVAYQAPYIGVTFIR